jgi:hypothetical protein
MDVAPLMWSWLEGDDQSSPGPGVTVIRHSALDEFADLARRLVMHFARRVKLSLVNFG